MKSSFGAYFKKTLLENLRIVLVAVLVSIFVLVPMLSDWTTHEFFHYTVNERGYVNKIYDGSALSHELPEGAVRGFETNFGIAIAFVIILSLAVPIYNFAKFKNRRNLDTLYSLPISRKKLALAHYLSGLIAVLVPTAIGFLVEIGFIIGYGAFSYIDLGWTTVYFLLLMLMGWLLYSMNLFVFNEANHIFDGVAFIIGWNLVFYIVSDLSNLIGSLFEDLLLPVGYIMEIMSRVEAVIETTPFYIEWFFEFETVIAFTLLWLILGLLSVVLFFIRCDKQRPERVGGVSDSFFGYKTLIPLYAGSIIWFSNVGTSLSRSSGVLFIFAMAFIGYIIFRRSLKFKPCDYWTLGGMAVLTLMVAAKNFIPY